MAIYDLGTASLAANGEVTGVGTTWKAPLTLIRVGATIVFKTEPVQIYTISEIISDTQVNVYNPNSETVPAGTGYAILAHDGITVQGLAQDVAETLRFYQSRETEVSTAVDIFKDFDQDKFSADVAQVNTQFGEISTIGSQVSSDAAQVSADKDAAYASSISAQNSANIAESAAESVSGALVGNFDDGVTLQSKNQVIIQFIDGYAKQFLWSGSFPKVVPAGSTPESTGGEGPGAWISAGDASLRNDINNGYLNTKYFRVYKNVDDMMAGNLREGDNVTWNGYYNSGDGGGNIGIVVKGTLVSDNGSIFSIGNGLYVKAIFDQCIDPLKFGISGSRTSAQNKIQYDRMIAYAASLRMPIVYSRSMDYQCDPIVISGAGYDWFTIRADRGNVTHRCPSTSSYAFILQGSATTASNVNTFQYCTVSGLRLVSSYGCIYTRYTENLVIEKCLFSGGSLNSATGVAITMAYNGPLETDIKPRVRSCIFSYCKHAILGQTAIEETDQGRVSDAVFEDLVALNCGGATGDFVYRFPYLDGAILNKVEAYQDSFNTVASNGILLQKPTLVNLTNCNVFEVGGYGIQITSPRGVCIDSSNTIQGVGKQGNRAALAVTSMSPSLTTQNVKLSPKIRDCYGSAVTLTGVSNIDLSGLEEYDNAKGGGVAGWTFTNCTNIKMHNVRADSPGSFFMQVSGSSVELFNPTYLQYTSQISIVNGGTVVVLPAQRILQVSSPTTTGGIVDEVQYDASGGSAVVTLPYASGFPGKLIRIVKTDNSGSGVAVFPPAGSGQLINGASSYSIRSQYGYVQLRSTGANWIIVGKS